MSPHMSVYRYNCPNYKYRYAIQELLSCCGSYDRCVSVIGNTAVGIVGRHAYRHAYGHAFIMCQGYRLVTLGSMARFLNEAANNVDGMERRIPSAMSDPQPIYFRSCSAAANCTIGVCMRVRYHGALLYGTCL